MTWMGPLLPLRREMENSVFAGEGCPPFDRVFQGKKEGNFRNIAGEGVRPAPRRKILQKLDKSEKHAGESWIFSQPIVWQIPALVSSAVHTAAATAYNAHRIDAVRSPRFSGFSESILGQSKVRSCKTLQQEMQKTDRILTIYIATSLAH